MALMNPRILTKKKVVLMNQMSLKELPGTTILKSPMNQEKKVLKKKSLIPNQENLLKRPKQMKPKEKSN
jgi:hypothetical protein